MSSEPSFSDPSICCFAYQLANVLVKIRTDGREDEQLEKILAENN